MAATLRDVLTAFEEAREPLILRDLAARLDLSPGMLEGMIAYWIRKGKLRESVSGHHCGTCGSAEGCPFVMQLPRSYELVTDDDPLACAPMEGGCRCCF